MEQDKARVFYRGEALPYGQSALLTPVDHPDVENVSNEKLVRTSKVLSWDKYTGCIETVNTIYRPLKETT